MHTKTLKSHGTRIAKQFKLRIIQVLGPKILSKIKDTLPQSIFKPSMSKRTTSKLLSRMNKRFFLALLILICISSSLVIIAESQRTAAIIGNHGNLKIDGVGVYQNANCSIPVTNLDWGTLEPGTAENITLYIRNEGNHAANLSMMVNNWNPINASTYMALNWNYSGQTLSPAESIAVTLTLSVSSAARNVVDFSFDVIIGTD
jgi:hypothetical protein